MSVKRLLTKIKRYNPDSNVEIIIDAYDFARKAHRGVKRKSGEPYIFHPFEVAKILVEYKMDDYSIAAGMLHDVVEDTSYDLGTISARFGPTVSLLVDGLTKIASKHFNSKTQARAENFRKLILSTAKDPRVIIIKLADRLHNMQTIYYINNEKKQVQIASETLEIYAPIAHRLGMNLIKVELENRSFQILNGAKFYEIASKLRFLYPEREKILMQITDRLKREFKKQKVKTRMKYRTKHYYSIYKKLQKGKEFGEIYDLFGIRIITENYEDCYRVLGVINKYFTVISGRYKDFIIKPKPNGYQSIHTTIIYENRYIEFQIRTEKMDRIAERGIAAHWNYKELSQQKPIDKFWGEFKHVLEWAMDEGDFQKFLRYLKLEFIEDRIYVSTPAGDVKELPVRATIIDFAYYVHTELGNHCIGGKVNGKMSSIDTQLQNGDIVEVVTSENQKPKIDWLEFVVTSRARSSIKKWIKENETEFVVRGKAMFDETIKAFEEKYHQKLMVSDIKSQLTNWGLKDMENLYEDIGTGVFTKNRMLEYLRQAFVQRKKQKKKTSKKPAADDYDDNLISKVIVEGIDSSQLRFAKCCMPVEGDEIVGFVTYNHKISIHKKSCKTIQRYIKNDERIVYAYWDRDKLVKKISVEFEIRAEDRYGIKNDILKKLVKINQEFGDLEIKKRKGGMIFAKINLLISNINAIEDVVNAISGIEGILEVKPKSKFI